MLEVFERGNFCTVIINPGFTPTSANGYKERVAIGDFVFQYLCQELGLATQMGVVMFDLLALAVKFVRQAL